MTGLTRALNRRRLVRRRTDHVRQFVSEYLSFPFKHKNNSFHQWRSHDFISGGSKNFGRGEIQPRVPTHFCVRAHKHVRKLDYTLPIIVFTIKYVKYYDFIICMLAYPYIIRINTYNW